MRDPATLPAVAIVGRPNVGKSTLFNRLIGRRAALVHDRPGVTRDRKDGAAALFGLEFRVTDTAGLERTVQGAIEERMVAQSWRAVEQADAVLFVIDARTGVQPQDRHFAELLRRSGKPIVLVANKCESRAGEAGVLDAFDLGFGEAVAISAEHGAGLGDLFEALRRVLPEPQPEAPAETEGEPAEDGEADAPAPPRRFSLAIVGQPNAGKSTLMNRLLGEERVITGPEPGLTRDAIAIEWSWQGRAIRLIDTAGLRKRQKVSEDLEKLSAIDAMRAVQFAEVVILLIDAATVRDFGEGLEKQDLQIARQVEEEGRALVVAINKWDLMDNPGKLRGLIVESLEQSLSQLRGVPVITLSALDGTGIARLMSEVVRIHDVWNKRVSTSRLNTWLKATLEANPPPLVRRRRLKIRFMTQAKARPPTFAFFANMPADMPDSYMRYLANSLRKAFGFEGVPLRLHVKGGTNPFADQKSRPD